MCARPDRGVSDIIKGPHPHARKTPASGGGAYCAGQLKSIATNRRSKRGRRGTPPSVICPRAAGICHQATKPSAEGKDGFTPGDLMAVDVGVQGRPEPTFGQAD